MALQTVPSSLPGDVGADQDDIGHTVADLMTTSAGVEAMVMSVRSLAPERAATVASRTSAAAIARTTVVLSTGGASGAPEAPGLLPSVDPVGSDTVSSGPSENTVDGDLDGDAIGALRGSVALGVALDGGSDAISVIGDDSGTFQREPSAPIDLAHRGTAAWGCEDVSGLAAGRERDHPDQAGIVVPREPDRDDVRAAVGSQRGEGGEVPLAEEERDRIGKVHGVETAHGVSET